MILFSYRMGAALGSGFYGKVYKATYTMSPTNAIDVAVKTLHEGATEHERVKFLQEAALMTQFKHVNVLGLHGIIVEKDSVSVGLNRFQCFIIHTLVVPTVHDCY